MTSQKTPQTMKPATAAKKLGVYLPATPQEFQETVISREELNVLQASPPEWLVELRKNGPHPRPTVAARLGVSIAGLARGEVSEALTTDEINEIRDDEPDWLVRERKVQLEVLAEEQRVRERDAKLAAKVERRANNSAAGRS
ncbi:hypothetical protein SAMN05216410_2544 [Sanguibacter gelidistatuariae]|uniref:Uncharacterized protein n=1 Tax=Sanguibacter gelidistatuariae TaxID=1814289 RepID=A0A1G6QHG8_9MICO|nr:DUF5997 family protein [Sanguibacter gelidistatuariae]SDC91758.1 hypothetical protein SAMN05216410_2544 [Sanguibacter gelidistatuariae]